MKIFSAIIAFSQRVRSDGIVQSPDNTTPRPQPGRLQIYCDCHHRRRPLFSRSDNDSGGGDANSLELFD